MFSTKRKNAHKILLHLYIRRKGKFLIQVLAKFEPLERNLLNVSRKFKPFNISFNNFLE